MNELWWIKYFWLWDDDIEKINWVFGFPSIIGTVLFLVFLLGFDEVRVFKDKPYTKFTLCLISIPIIAFFPHIVVLIFIGYGVSILIGKIREEWI